MSKIRIFHQISNVKMTLFFFQMGKIGKLKIPRLWPMPPTREIDLGFFLREKNTEENSAKKVLKGCKMY